MIEKILTNKMIKSGLRKSSAPNLAISEAHLNTLPSPFQRAYTVHSITNEQIIHEPKKIVDNLDFLNSFPQNDIKNNEDSLPSPVNRRFSTGNPDEQQTKEPHPIDPKIPEIINIGKAVRSQSLANIKLHHGLEKHIDEIEHQKAQKLAEQEKRIVEYSEKQVEQMKLIIDSNKKIKENEETIHDLEKKLKESTCLLSESKEIYDKLSNKQENEIKIQKELNETLVAEIKILREQVEIKQQLEKQLYQSQVKIFESEEMIKQLKSYSNLLQVMQQNAETMCLNNEEKTIQLKQCLNQTQIEYQNILQQHEKDAIISEERIYRCMEQIEKLKDELNEAIKFSKNQQEENEQEKKISEERRKEALFARFRLERYQNRELIHERDKKMKSLKIECDLGENILSKLRHQVQVLQVDPMLSHIGHGQVRRRLTQVKQKLTRAMDDYASKINLLKVLKTQHEFQMKTYDIVCGGDVNELKNILENYMRTSSSTTKTFQQEMNVSYLPVNASWIINAADSTGQTLLHYACIHQYNSMVDYLLSLKELDIGAGEPKLTPLMIASEHGYEYIVKRLLEYNVDIDARDDINQTSLLRACKKGKLPIIQLLIDHGASTDVVDNYGHSCLHLSVLSNSLECVQYLLKKGLMNNQKNIEGKDARTLAAISGYSFIAQLLEQN